MNMNNRNKINMESLNPTLLKNSILDVKKGQQTQINEYNAAEKIERLPLSIQKLVWRALYYRNEIRARKPMFLRGDREDEKLSKFINRDS